MKFKYFKWDYSDYIRADIISQAGRYQETFIYNSEEVTHCCELTPSYTCHPVGFDIDLPVSDGIYDDLMDGFTYDPIYFYCHVIDKIAKDCPPPPDRWEDDTDEEYLEDCLEYYRANCGALA